jgi:cell cycle checkpoint control protein RAD9A
MPGIIRRLRLMKQSVLAVLGKASSIASVERLDLTIVDPDSSLRKRRKRDKSRSETATPRDEDDYEHSEDEAVGGIEAKLIMKLVCKHGEFGILQFRTARGDSTSGMGRGLIIGVVKKHSLHLGTSEFLRAEVDPDTTPSTFTVSARALRDMLDHFSLAAPGFQANTGYRGENQLGWMFAQHEIRVKSWETTQSSLCTEIKVDPAEFDYYWLENNVRVDLTLPMREFRVGFFAFDRSSPS